MVDVEIEADFLLMSEDGVGGWSIFLWVTDESDSFYFFDGVGVEAYFHEGVRIGESFSFVGIAVFDER